MYFSIFREVCSGKFQLHFFIYNRFNKKHKEHLKKVFDTLRLRLFAGKLFSFGNWFS